MPRCRRPLLVALGAIALLAAGCGFGPGSSSEGTSRLLVTRDYGAERLLGASEDDPAESETVLRFLDREADIETRYGGGFVQSIEGRSGGLTGGRSFDWFFYVNGIESEVGSAERPVHGGDRIWWDYRDWTDAMRVPAVVGSFPEPFLQASAGADRLPVQVVCAGDRDPCDEAARRLAEAGADASIERLGERGRAEPAMRLLVGPWGRLQTDPAAAQLADGPAGSGVFAEFERRGGDWRLFGLDDHDRVAARLGSGAGLIAALRLGEDPVTWVVTGGGHDAVDAAADALGEPALERRYAVAIADDAPVRLPVEGAGAGG